MAKCALLNRTTWEIDNVIEAKPDDPTPDGYIMVVIPDDIPAGPGWQFYTGHGFVSPIDAQIMDIKQAEVTLKPNSAELLAAIEAEIQPVAIVEEAPAKVAP